VVATAYVEKRPPRQEQSSFREPAGEPRVRRVTSSRVSEVDVPEFIPRY
jgi:hypothetical protein